MCVCVCVHACMYVCVYVAELRDNLSKSRGSYDDLTKQLENMVAR